MKESNRRRQFDIILTAVLLVVMPVLPAFSFRIHTGDSINDGQRRFGEVLSPGLVIQSKAFLEKYKDYLTHEFPAKKVNAESSLQGNNAFAVRGDPAAAQAERLTRIAFYEFSVKEKTEISRKLKIFSSPDTGEGEIIKEISSFFAPLARENLLNIEMIVNALKGILDIERPEIIASWTYYSGFFRDAKLWEQVFRAEARNSVSRKVMAEDLSLMAKSIGSETGEEAYTIAFILYEELLAYYQEHREEIEWRFKTDSWEGWISLWNIGIEAYDKSLMALNFIKEARYSCCDREDYFIGKLFNYAERQELPTYKGGVTRENEFFWEQLSEESHPVGLPYKINPLIRNWVRPVYLDLVDVRAEVILRKEKADFIFFQQTAYLLDKVKRGRGKELGDFLFSCFDHAYPWAYVTDFSMGITVKKNEPVVSVCELEAYI